MCGRKNLNQLEIEFLEKWLNKPMKWKPTILRDEPRFNIPLYDHPQWPIITNEDPDSLVFYTTGLIHRNTRNFEKASEARGHCLNAKCETIFDLSSFKHSIMDRRCIVLVSGFFEWKWMGKKSFPHYICRKDKMPFFMGGIWDRWTDPETTGVGLYETYSIVTVDAPRGSILADVHNKKLRSPLMFNNVEDAFKWLSPMEKDQIKEMMVYCGDENLLAYPISRNVNADDKSARFNIPEILEEQHYHELDWKQGELF
jgi:putative SOS response-associated peptidase YedK